MIIPTIYIKHTCFINFELSTEIALSSADGSQPRPPTWAPSRTPGRAVARLLYRLLTIPRPTADMASFVLCQKIVRSVAQLVLRRHVVHRDRRGARTWGRPWPPPPPRSSAPLPSVVTQISFPHIFFRMCTPLSPPWLHKDSASPHPPPSLFVFKLTGSMFLVPKLTN